MSGLRDIAEGDGLGDLSADDWNRHNRATKFVEAFRNTLPGKTSLSIRGDGIVRVKNTTGVTLPTYSVLGISAPLFDPNLYFDGWRQEVALLGVVPSASHSRKFCILAEPLANNEIGRAWASSIAPCRISEATFSGAETADIIAGNTEMLDGSTSGFPIVWVSTPVYPPDNYRWAMIRMGAASAGSGTITVGYIIESIQYDIVHARITARPAGMPEVPDENYGMIELYDDVYQCLLDEPDEDLIGRRGDAAYMTLDAGQESYAQPKWQAMGICCP